MDNYQKIQELLAIKADYQSRLKLIPYDGSPEIKTRDNKQYIYIRKRVASKLTSTYVDVYTPELYDSLVKSSLESRKLKKEIKNIEKELAVLGYSGEELSAKVILNLDYARASIKEIIYDQAILEGVSTTFPQTETIIENGTIIGMKASDVQKILNLKHAWKFILDKDLLTYPSNFDIISHIAKLVNEGFYETGGRIRCVPVTIGGSTYKPPIPMELDVKENINLLAKGNDVYLNAINICLYCMKTQIFIDGNKRASVIFANHYLISNGAGLLIIPERLVPEFKNLLIDYYEKKNTTIIDFMLNNCIRKI